MPYGNEDYLKKTPVLSKLHTSSQHTIKKLRRIRCSICFRTYILVFESRIHKLKNREEIPGCSKAYLEVTAVISGKLPSGSACSMPYGNEDYL
ncbi:hypothetical protein T4A_7311 [Trichinella pseudospiralis]|uniref:Uncharacterized protein n=1 Tax=Trichinella pseudospiralis TaxID=6337 RepID=A0A0V1E7R0_TRIPS|nr:hypothetical protein T4A_7311 [Trichinella pseudospiralis]